MPRAAPTLTSQIGVNQVDSVPKTNMGAVQSSIFLGGVYSATVAIGSRFGLAASGEPVAAVLRHGRTFSAGR